MIKKFFVWVVMSSSICAMEGEIAPIKDASNNLMKEVRRLVHGEREERIAAGTQIKKLIKEGVDINQCDKTREYPLWYAIQYNDENTMKFLIALKADVNPEYELSPLLCAAEQRNPLFTDILLRNGADVTHKWKYMHYTTALQVALQRIDFECNMSNGDITSTKQKVQWLIEKDSDVNVKSGHPYNKTCIQYAIEGHHAEFVTMLLNAGAKFTTEDIESLEIHIATCRNNNYYVTCDIKSLAHLIPEKPKKEPKEEIAPTESTSLCFLY